MNNYLRIGKIHEGSYGVVYKGKNKLTGQFVIVKKLKLASKYPGFIYIATSVISHLKELNHPNIVKLQHHVIPNRVRRVMVIYEYFSMNLKMYIDSLGHGQFMDPSLVKSYLYQINSAVFYCHQRHIVHRNLTPQNIFIDETGVIKVADFSLGQVFCVPQKLCYKAPETIMGCRNYSPSIDMWSIGCIFCEMASKKILFRGGSEISQLFCIFSILKTPTEEIWPSLSSLPYYSSDFPILTMWNLNNHVENLDDVGVDLLQKMLIYDPVRRISARDTLTHEYFRNLQLPPGLTVVNID